MVFNFDLFLIKTPACPLVLLLICLWFWTLRISFCLVLTSAWKINYILCICPGLCLAPYQNITLHNNTTDSLTQIILFNAGLLTTAEKLLTTVMLVRLGKEEQITMLLTTSRAVVPTTQHYNGGCECLLELQFSES